MGGDATKLDLFLHGPLRAIKLFLNVCMISIMAGVCWECKKGYFQMNTLMHSVRRRNNSHRVWWKYILICKSTKIKLLQLL